jgi:hypothetical protein
MSAFVLFFALFAALRRGRLSLRDFGRAILVCVHDWFETAEAFDLHDVARLHRWMNWAEWAARRADPAAARLLIRRDDQSLEGLVRRMAACAGVLADAPAKPPKVRRARRRSSVRRVRCVWHVGARRAALSPKARDPPTNTAPSQTSIGRNRRESPLARGRRRTPGRCVTRAPGSLSLEDGAEPYASAS